MANPTTRIPISSLCTSQKASYGNILWTRSGIIDPLVSKQLENKIQIFFLYNINNKIQQQKIKEEKSNSISEFFGIFWVFFSSWNLDFLWIS